MRSFLSECFNFKPIKRLQKNWVFQIYTKNCLANSIYNYMSPMQSPVYMQLKLSSHYLSPGQLFVQVRNPDSFTHFCLIILITATLTEKGYRAWNVCFIFSTAFAKIIFAFLNVLQIMFAEMHVGSHIKCQLYFSEYNYNWNMSTNLKKFQNITFHKNLFGGFGAITSGQRDWQTDRHSKDNTHTLCKFLLQKC
jgi:hypothetical protein